MSKCSKASEICKPFCYRFLDDHYEYYLPYGTSINCFRILKIVIIDILPCFNDYFKLVMIVIRYIFTITIIRFFNCESVQCRWPWPPSINWLVWVDRSSPLARLAHCFPSPTDGIQMRFRVWFLLERYSQIQFWARRLIAPRGMFLFVRELCFGTFRVRERRL